MNGVFGNYVICECPFCGDTNEVELSDADIEMYHKYSNGKKLIREAFPKMDRSIRELLKTGLCQRCYSRMSAIYSCETGEDGIIAAENNDRGEIEYLVHLPVWETLEKPIKVRIKAEDAMSALNAAVRILCGCEEFSCSTYSEYRDCEGDMSLVYDLPCGMVVPKEGTSVRKVGSDEDEEIVELSLFHVAS